MRIALHRSAVMLLFLDRHRPASSLPSNDVGHARGRARFARSLIAARQPVSRIVRKSSADRT